MNDLDSAIARILEAEKFGAVATVISGPAMGTKAVIDESGVILAGTLPEEITTSVAEDAVELLEHEQNRALEYGDHEVFIETLAPPPDLYIFGAVHIGQALASFAGQMGYRVTVVDSRQMFATEERFPTAHRVLVGWPRDLVDQLHFDRRSWVVVLSHDPRHETPALEAALKGHPRYIGAMGSRRTHDLRVERLGGLGFTADEISTIHSPIGLDIGAETPQEVAVSILAEMTKVRYGAGSGLSLHGVGGRVHKQRADDE